MVALLAGCASASSGGPGGSGDSSGPGGNPSASSPSSPAPGAGGLRGTQASSIRCASTVWQPDDTTAVTLPAAPVRVVICPLPMPNPVHKTADLRPPPADLLHALALPDTPKPTGSAYACAAYADVPRLIYAEVPGGQLYLLHLPVDECGHYLASVLTVVNEYAQQTPLTS